MIVFIGYSLSDYDTHAQQIFRKAAQSKRVIVINPSRGDLQKFIPVMGTDVKLRQLKFLDCQYFQPTSTT